MAENQEVIPPTVTGGIKFKMTGEMLPRNDRTEKLLEARRQEELRLKKDKDERELKFAKEQKDKARRDKNRKREKEQKEKMEAEQAQKEMMERQERARLEGKITIISNKLRTNTSPAQYSLSGIELSTATVGIIANDIKVNKTLRTLHLCKKKINDEQGAVLADMLILNKFLLKLELEGNLLGAKTAIAFGKVLKDQNKTLVYLDLENNFLTNSGASYDEVKSFSDCLITNKSLLHLNLANNGMNEECGERFVTNTGINKSLICFEFGFNQFLLEDIRIIQENLKDNKAKYDKDRFMEWKERKRMAEEERAMKILVTVEQKDDMMKEEAELSRIAREKARDAAWKEFLMESELDKQRLIQRLEEAAKMRKAKPKRKARGKKKK
jgi:hypothetical protein